MNGGTYENNWGIFIGIIVIIVILILVAGYFGVVPGLSNLFGSNKPIDLGGSYTLADYQSALAKSGIQFLDNTDTIPLDKSQRAYGPAKAVNVDFTASEAMALLNEKPHSVDFPFKDWQIRINSDGTVEVSAVILMDEVSSYATTHGVSNDALTQILDIVKKVGIVQKEIPFYIKGSASVINGQIDFDALSVKIGRLPVSAELANSHKADIIDVINDHKGDIPGFSCNNANIVNGKIHFDGTLPSYIKHK